jgi:phosphatidate cytidylyltransferase
MSGAAGAWSDLRTRILSAVVLTIVGLGCLFLGGFAFYTLASIIAGVILWEVALMSGRDLQIAAHGLGIIGAASLWFGKVLGDPMDVVMLLLPVAVGMIFVVQTWSWMIFAAEVMFGTFALTLVSAQGGAVAILFIVACVAASDILGYFVGRAVGGPKFWPAISPKKTWSGTVAGWVGALAVGIAYGMWLGRGLDLWIITLALIFAVAGQAGDIAESALKRRMGVKDSSNLIPGHGGFFDRFDALLGAAVAAFFIVSAGYGWW